MSHCGAWAGNDSTQAGSRRKTKDCGEREVEDKDILVILKNYWVEKKVSGWHIGVRNYNPMTLEGIRQFTMVNRGPEEIAMTLKELTLITIYMVYFLIHKNNTSCILSNKLCYMSGSKISYL
jgi:hypothetical protein